MLPFRNSIIPRPSKAIASLESISSIIIIHISLARLSSFFEEYKVASPFCDAWLNASEALS